MAGNGHRIAGENPLDHLARLRREDPELQAEFDRQKPHWDAVRALVEARTKAGLSQRELAARMHVSQAVIGRLESGEHSPRIDTLARAAEALGMDLEVRFKRPAKAR